MLRPFFSFKKERAYMRIVATTYLDPAYNLALEEYLVTGFSDTMFRLWQNPDCIIVGRNQNTLSEINYDFVREKGIPVIRRMSGGGAVFHDLGNINYTFAREAGENDFNNYSRFAEPIINVLREMGVAAELSGRNDLCIDGKKFSGNAQYMWKGRMLHHGTLLLHSNVAILSEALKVNPLKIQSKGIASIRSRVTNINEHLATPINVKEFMQKITEEILRQNPDAEVYELTEKDKEEVEKLVQNKYSTYEWNFGYSPKYSYHHEAYFPCGLFEVNLQVEDGLICAARIFGDYFGKKDVGEVEQLLLGKKHDYDTLKSVLSSINLSDYFSGLSLENLLSLLFS